MGSAVERASPAPDPATGVLTVRALHRLPSDVVAELMEVLSGDPRLVVCDLRGMAAAGHSLVEVFAPVAPYLANWPATLMVVCVERLDADARMLPAIMTNRLFVHECPEAGLAEAQALLRPMQHTMTYLSPTPQAAPRARVFAIQTVRDWDLPLLAGPVGLVASELVTHSLLHNRTVLAFSLSRLTADTCGATPIGVFRDVDRGVYDELMAEQLRAAREKKDGELEALLHAGDTWTL